MPLKLSFRLPFHDEPYSGGLRTLSLILDKYSVAVSMNSMNSMTYQTPPHTQIGRTHQELRVTDAAS